MNLISKKIKTPSNRILIIAILVLGTLIVLIPRKEPPAQKTIEPVAETYPLWSIDSLEHRLQQCDSLFNLLKEDMEKIAGK